jgi:hypothetical protein
MAALTGPLGATQDLPTLRLALRPLPDVPALLELGGLAGLAPFVLARQTLPAPDAVLPRVVPGDPGHRLIPSPLGKRRVFPMVGCGPPGRQDEFLVLAIRHFGGIEML